MSDRRESDRLLELAERQLERVALARRRSFVIWVLLVTDAIAALPITWATFTVHPLRSFFMFAACSASTVVFAIFAVFLLRETLESRRVEESVLNEALSLVQESEKYLADKEQWTLLERAEFRLRLRRLPVGVASPATSATASPTPTPASTRPPTAV